MTNMTNMIRYGALLIFALGATRTEVAQAQNVVYYHTDALGSVAMVTDASRNVIEKNEYEPYGKVVNHALQDGPGYTGHVADARTGLIYMQQRYYDDDLGGFPTVDPVSADSLGGSFNRYQYANNNPYRFVDPDGRRGRISVKLVATNPAPDYFVKELQYLVNHTDGVNASIDKILEKDININLVYSDDKTWKGRADSDSRTFWLFADTRRSIEYEVDGTTYVLPTGLALKHEIDHAEEFANRDAGKLRSRSAIEREEERVTNREKDNADKLGQPGRRDHRDGEFRDVGSPCPDDSCK
jgi:RHS repeat-associated protein